MKRELYIHKNSLFTKCASVIGKVAQRLRSCLRICTTLRIGTVTISTFLIISIGLPEPAQTQTLDAAIVNQLTGDAFSDCAVLNASGSNSFNRGPNLQAICATVSGVATGSSAGGAAGSSPQSLAITVENRRKAQLKKEQEEGTISTANGASFNLSEGVSLFVSGNLEALNRSKTTFADGYDSDIAGVTVGVDKLITPKMLAGLAFIYNSTNGSFDGGGGFNTNSYGGILYGSFFPWSGIFVDLGVGFARKDYSSSRLATYTESGGQNNIFSGVLNNDTDGNEISVRTLLGYDHSIANVTFGPRFGLNWTNTHIDDYSEEDGGQAIAGPNANTGGAGLTLSYEDQYINSFQSVIGLQGSVAFSTRLGVFVPQFNADYIHEFANSQRSVTVHFVEDLRQNPSKFSFQTEKPVRNFFTLSTGVAAILAHGIQPFVNFRVMVGNEQFNNYAGSFGIRIQL